MWPYFYILGSISTRNSWTCRCYTTTKLIWYTSGSGINSGRGVGLIPMWKIVKNAINFEKWEFWPTSTQVCSPLWLARGNKPSNSMHKQVIYPRNSDKFLYFTSYYLVHNSIIRVIVRYICIMHCKIRIHQAETQFVSILQCDNVLASWFQHTNDII